jgi:hypothetical protein
METEQKASAAYLPFRTFETGLDHLATITIPNTIENGTFPNMNPHNKWQMVSALKFFKLVDSNGKPQPFLYDLVKNKAERKANIKKLIEDSYPDIVELDFATMTVTELDKALSGDRYNVSGETKKKAKTFLLKAAQYAGFTVHPLLTKITRNRRKGSGKQTAASGGSAVQSDASGNGGTSAETINKRTSEGGSEKMIQLRRGGSLTLSYSVNLWELKGEDRKFVFDLIDKIDAYEEGSKDSTDDALPLGDDAKS